MKRFLDFLRNYWNVVLTVIVVCCVLFSVSVCIVGCKSSNAFAFATATAGAVHNEEISYEVSK